MFGFTHRNRIVREFVRLSIDGEGRAPVLLLVTASHYIYLNGNIQAAGSARVGDVVLLGNGRSNVVGNTDILGLVEQVAQRLLARRI